ncbi:MAG: arabinan endo-1,5-alpha-L-arabinosidase [Muribaculum sp.]|nr:arabinan endo-1,5-alpha-L-arabinosidase [Muribaculum sp.]
MKRFKHLLLSIVSIGAIALSACGDKGGNGGGDDNQGFVSVGAPVAESIGTVSATLKSTVTLSGSAKYDRIGFCYASEANPSLGASMSVNAKVTAGVAVAELIGLEPATTYYVKAFATGTSEGTIYSSEYQFTTNEITIDEQLAEYVAPDYPDDYRTLADWAKRDQWNLANVHDPSVVKADDGYYYMYQTDASFGNAHTAGGHFHGRRSKDLVNWEYLGGVMTSLPGWVIPKLNEFRAGMGLNAANPPVSDFGYWAPCVRKVRSGLYRMYYSIVCPGNIDGSNSWGERAFIGMMENSDPANNSGWVDKGYVVTNPSDKGLNFYVRPNDWANCYFKINAIDPSYIITPSGEHWLVYGSWHSGIYVVKLDAETGLPDINVNPWGTEEEIAPYGKLIYTRQLGNRWQGSEGPEVVYRNGYYYLFLAYDALDVPYNTRVLRATDIEGPYLDMYGTRGDLGGDAYPILTHPYKFANSHGWVGISHCAVFDDGQDNWYFASQGRLPEIAGDTWAPNANMLGHVRAIRWTNDGWPLVMPERYGAVPQVPITEDEIAGVWEHIDLSYKYGEQRSASAMTFKADHTISSGAWKGGTWSYDATTQILTANGVELYLMRECDWERNPRTHTIVYAGLGNRKTYWGKKSK